MTGLIKETDRFRQWANIYPQATKFGEWECDYEHWPALCTAVLEFVAGHPFASWSEAEVRAVLYSVARDNESQHLSTEIRRQHPELIVPLVRASLNIGERDNQWQLAVELGYMTGDPEIESLLLVLARNEDEYVRRRALGSLLAIGSSAVEVLALEAWHRPDEQQEHARMMALHCLSGISSPHVEPLLSEALRDKRQYLRGYAERMRHGELPNDFKQA